MEVILKSFKSPEVRGKRKKKTSKKIVRSLYFGFHFVAIKIETCLKNLYFITGL
jgi:hypothetical protein